MSLSNLLYSACVKEWLFSWVGGEVVSAIKRGSTCCVALSESRETLLLELLVLFSL